MNGDSEREKRETRTFSFKDLLNAEKSISDEFEGTSTSDVKNSFQIKQGPYRGACPNCGYCPCCGRTICQWPSYPYWRPYWHCSPNATPPTCPVDNVYAGYSVGASN